MRALLASAFLLLALAAPANAAEVAKVDGATLTANDDRADDNRPDSDFCVSVKTEGSASETCHIAPGRPYEALVAQAPGSGRRFVGGAVPVAVTHVDVERVDGVRVGADTVAGERYRGRQAGKVRFFLLAVPRGREVALVRMFGADGALLGAVAPEDEGAKLRGPVRLLNERRSGAAMKLSATTSRVLTPTPLALDRTEEQACLRASSRGLSSTICPPPVLGPVLVVTVTPGCGRLGSMISGVVGEEVTAVRVLLGSGRRVTLRPRSLPASVAPGRRYVAAVLPAGEAVRSASAVGAVARQELGEPPTDRRCGRSDGGFFAFAPDIPESPVLPPAPGDQSAGEADGHRLVVRDAAGDRLCAGVDRLTGDDCGLPPADPRDIGLLVRDGVVAAALPGDVARVRLPGGREVATLPGDGYTGRYAGRVRFLLAEVGANTLGFLRLLGADGRSLGRGVILSLDPEATRGPVTLASGRGWRLRGARFGTLPCIGIGPLNPYGCVSGGPPASVLVTVGCSPRVAVLYGTLGRRNRSVTATLRGGRRLRARILRVPKRFGGGRAFVLALPRRAELTAVRLDGKRYPMRVPPAAGQCGYTVSESVSDGPV